MERNSKSRIIRLCRIHANESWIFARIAKFQFQTCLRETSFETRHRRVTRRTTNRTSLGEFVRKNGSSVDKIIRVVGTRLHPRLSSREKKKFIYARNWERAHLGAHRRTKLQPEEKRHVGSRPFRVSYVREMQRIIIHVERVRKNQTKNRKLCLI